MNKGRLEAFSDGVIAIIITIMVLQLTVPKEPTFAALRRESGATGPATAHIASRLPRGPGSSPAAAELELRPPRGRARGLIRRLGKFEGTDP